MNFRTIKTSIKDILANSANGRFIVVGAQRQTKSAEEVKGNNRFVQIYYGAGQFPKGSAGQTGTQQHDATYRIELTASASAKGDLSILNDPQATNADRMLALASMKNASDEADDSIDELFDIVWNILLDAISIDLGLPVGTVINRWIENVEKDEPVATGELVILTMNVTFTLRTYEDVMGDQEEQGAPPEKIFDNEITTFDTEGDNEDIETKTGAQVLTTP